MNIRRWWQSIKTLPYWGSPLQTLMTPTIGVLAGTLPVVPTLQWSADENCIRRPPEEYDCYWNEGIGCKYHGPP